MGRVKSSALNRLLFCCTPKFLKNLLKSDFGSNFLSGQGAQRGILKRERIVALGALPHFLGDALNVPCDAEHFSLWPTTFGRQCQPFNKFGQCVLSSAVRGWSSRSILITSARASALACRAL